MSEVATRVLPPPEFFKDQIRDWPTQPGVYLMRDEFDRILYVGKAKSLRNRIRNYFQSPDTLPIRTRGLVKRIAKLEFTVVKTELDALLLECNLIKKHRPRFNVRLKDDKNFPYVVLDFTQPYPQFRITRKVVAAPNLRYFGPYSGRIREISRFLLKTFQIRDCSDSKFKNRKRPCLNYEIGTCTGPCVDLVTEEAYAKQIRDAMLFLNGRRQALVQQLKAEMQTHSEALEYEKARIVRDRIHAIETIALKQDAVSLNMTHDVDVLGSFGTSEEQQWVVMFVRSGFLTGRRAERVKFPLESEEHTKSFLEQFYAQSLLPDELWVVEDFPGREELQELLAQKAGKPFSIQVKRGEKALRLLGMALENARLLFEEKKDVLAGAPELQKVLSLPDVPNSIEGIDVSNFQGQSAAIALVHFADEKPLKSRYRIYHPRTVEGQDDFAMIYEAVTRRYRPGGDPVPDLLMIDGGKGQLASAVKALEDLGVNIPVCSLAKARTESAFTRKEVERSEERIFVPGRKNPIILREGNPALRLLQQVRDEAHRFSVKAHTIRRERWANEGGPLNEIEGVGEKTRDRLLKEFGSIETMAMAPVEALVKLGIPAARAEKILAALNAAMAEKGAGDAAGESADGDSAEPNEDTGEIVIEQLGDENAGGGDGEK